MTKILKLGRREVDEVPRKDHFWCAISVEYLVEAIDDEYEPTGIRNSLDVFSRMKINVRSGNLKFCR